MRGGRALQVEAAVSYNLHSHQHRLNGIVDASCAVRNY